MSKPGREGAVICNTLTYWMMSQSPWAVIWPLAGPLSFSRTFPAKHFEGSGCVFQIMCRPASCLHHLLLPRHDTSAVRLQSITPLPHLWSNIMHWQRDFSPDLCWVSTTNCSRLPASCTVLEDFPRSQHRPTLVHIGLTIPSQSSTALENDDGISVKLTGKIPSLYGEFHPPSFLVAVSQSRKHTGGSPGLCPRQPTPPSHEESVPCTRHAWTRNPEHCWKNTRSQETQT